MAVDCHTAFGAARLALRSPLAPCLLRRKGCGMLWDACPVRGLFLRRCCAGRWEPAEGGGGMDPGRFRLGFRQ